MNHYEAKQQARRERFKKLANKAEGASMTAYRRVKQIGDMIPFGQPILIGHHSERRHCGDIRRMDGLRSKCIEESQKAEHYKQKAVSVGTGGISSDDPAAVEKLRAELMKLEATQEHMKVCNKLVKKGDRAGLAVVLGCEAKASKMFIGDCMGRVGFPSYMLTNNSANIRRIKERIEALEAKSKRADVEQQYDGYTYREDTAENRVMFEFQGKPAEAVRSLLKSHAFKWSPSRGAWVRMLSGSGLYAAQRVKEGLAAIKNMEA